MGFQDRDYNRYDTGSGYGGGGMRKRAVKPPDSGANSANYNNIPHN